MSKFKEYYPSGKFLVDHSSKDGQFSGADTKKLFEANCGKMADNWHYRTKKIYYKHNQQGYRAPEFNTVDWNKSVVMFGCSNVYGVGLADDETLPGQLQKLLGVPVINMGIGGSSMCFSYYNQLMLHEKNTTPLGIVNVWTSPDRLLYFSGQYPNNVGAWCLTLSPQYKNMFVKWAADPVNPEAYAHIWQKSTQALWKDHKNHYECTFFSYCPLDVPQFGRIDFARDLMHPGPQSMRVAAIKIAEGLNL